MNCKHCHQPIHKEGNPPMWYHNHSRYSTCDKTWKSAEPDPDQVARYTDAMIHGPWGTR
jgi:hypothetical protein